MADHVQKGLTLALLTAENTDFLYLFGINELCGPMTKVFKEGEILLAEVPTAQKVATGWDI